MVEYLRTLRGRWRLPLLTTRQCPAYLLKITLLTTDLVYATMSRDPRRGPPSLQQRSLFKVRQIRLSCFAPVTVCCVTGGRLFGIAGKKRISLSATTWQRCIYEAPLLVIRVVVRCVFMSISKLEDFFNVLHKLSKH